MTTEVASWQTPLFHEWTIVEKRKVAISAKISQCKNSIMQKYHDAKNIIIQSIAEVTIWTQVLTVVKLSAVTLLKDQFCAQIATFVIASLVVH